MIIQFVLIILRIDSGMDESMKQIVSYIETHNTQQNEKIQKLQQANQEQHKIIMFLQEKVREQQAELE